MTALNYYISKEEILLAMDSLALESSTKDPLLFVSKMFPLPHLRLIICGTGCLQFVIDWFSFIQTSILAKDINELDKFSSNILRDISLKYFDMMDDFKTTIYHFGYLENSDTHTGFKYSAEDNFISTPLNYSVGIKPPISAIVEGTAEIKSLPEDFISIMHEQRQDDNSLPKEERVGIGGEIQIALLRKNRIFLETYHQFEDYRNLWNLMSNKLSSTSN